MTKNIGITVYSMSYGGVANFILGLASFLIEKGFLVTVIVTDAAGPWFDKLQEKGIKSKSFSNRPFLWIPFGRLMHAVIISRYIKSQHFHTLINNHSFSMHLNAKSIMRNSNLIHIVHNQIDSIIKTECDPISSKVVCVSKRIEEKGMKYVRPKGIITISNGVQLPPKEDLEYLSKVNRPKDILYVGRLDDKQKGILKIPKILKLVKSKINNIQLTIIGTGPDEDLLREEFRKLNLTTNVIFAGLLPPEDIKQYYKTYKTLLLPSNFEGHPLTLMEAMAYGCVPIVSLLPQCTDVYIEHGRNGYLIEQSNIIGFAEAIISEIEKADSQTPENALNTAQQKMSIELCHKKYLDLLDEIGESPIENSTNVIFKNYWKEIIPYNIIMLFKKVLSGGK